MCDRKNCSVVASEARSGTSGEVPSSARSVARTPSTSRASAASSSLGSTCPAAMFSASDAARRARFRARRSASSASPTPPALSARATDPVNSATMSCASDMMPRSEPSVWSSASPFIINVCAPRGLHRGAHREGDAYHTHSRAQMHTERKTTDACRHRCRRCTQNTHKRRLRHRHRHRNRDTDTYTNKNTDAYAYKYTYTNMDRHTHTGTAPAQAGTDTATHTGTLQSYKYHPEAGFNLPHHDSLVL